MGIIVIVELQQLAGAFRLNFVECTRRDMRFNTAFPLVNTANAIITRRRSRFEGNNIDRIAVSIVVVSRTEKGNAVLNPSITRLIELRCRSKARVNPLIH